MKRPTIAQAREALKGNLETDFTGMMEHAALTWDERVQYSIAISLKEIANRMGEK